MNRMSSKGLKKMDLEAVRQEYLIEKEIAERLRNAGKDQRRFLYRQLYDEFYQRVPTFAVGTRKSDAGSRGIIRQMRILKPFLKQDSIFMEVGPGSCALSFEAAKNVKTVYAVDVSEEIALRHDNPENFRLIISNGIDIPLPENSVDVAYSNQLMEHLHPEDAFDQLKDIYKAVAPGGVYICITPNRIYGPSDVSKYFDETATGLHLKEYTYQELSKLMISAGFKRVQAMVSTKNMKARVLVPVRIMEGIESCIMRLPRVVRKRVVSNRKIKRILSIKLIATK